MPIYSPNPMFDQLLESSHRDDSNNCSNIRFGEEISQVESIEVHFTALSGALGLSFTTISLFARQRRQSKRHWATVVTVADLTFIKTSNHLFLNQTL